MYIPLETLDSLVYCVITKKNPHIEEQTTQWPKVKVQRTNNDLQNIHIKLEIEQHEPH